MIRSQCLRRKGVDGDGIGLVLAISRLYVNISLCKHNILT